MLSTSGHTKSKNSACCPITTSTHPQATPQICIDPYTMASCMWVHKTEKQFLNINAVLGMNSAANYVTKWAPHPNLW
jgi:hypothetical protein